MAFDPTQPCAAYNDTTGTHLLVQQSAYYLPYPPYLQVATPASPLPGSGYYSVGGATTFSALTDAATAAIATTNASVANALALKATVGHIGRAADVTVGRAFVSTDFGVGVVPLNAVTVQAFSLSAAAIMGITGSGNVLSIQILGAAHTLTASAGVTITYGATSYVAVAVISFVPALNQVYTLVQRGISDIWDRR